MATLKKRSNEEANAASPSSVNKRFKTDYEEIVKVFVGPDKTPFNVHRATVCAKSKFFEAALTRDWKEKKDATVDLPDMAPYEFAIFVHWMYTGEIDKEGSGFKSPATGELYCGVFAAFLAGDVLDNETLRNQAITELLRVNTVKSIYPVGADISRYWNKTAESSPLRRCLVDLYASNASAKVLVEVSDHVPMIFIHQLLRAFVELRKETGKKRLSVATACKYHDHKETPTCSQT